MHNGCLSSHPTGFFSGEYRFATFDSSPLSFSSERSENPESRSIVPNLVLKPVEDLDHGSNLVWEKITFSLSIDKHVKSSHYRGMENPETCKYLK